MVTQRIRRNPKDWFLGEITAKSSPLNLTRSSTEKRSCVRTQSRASFSGECTLLCVNHIFHLMDDCVVDCFVRSWRHMKGSISIIVDQADHRRRKRGGWGGFSPPNFWKILLTDRFLPAKTHEKVDWAPPKIDKVTWAPPPKNHSAAPEADVCCVCLYLLLRHYSISLRIVLHASALVFMFPHFGIDQLSFDDNSPLFASSIAKKSFSECMWCWHILEIFC